MPIAPMTRLPDSDQPARPSRVRADEGRASTRTRGVGVQGPTNSILERGLDILGVFADAGTSLTVGELQRRVTLPQSTLYRLLRSMREKGWVVEEDGNRYRPGLRILEVARVARARLDIVDLAQPVMRQLSAATGETVLLASVAGNQAVCVERVEGRHLVRVSLERGTTLPLHAGASSKVLLAYVGEVQRGQILAGPLTRYTERTVTERTALERELAAIRERGYAYSHGEVDRGAVAIAAPLFAAEGRVVASLSLVGPDMRLEHAVDKLAAQVVAAAGTISKALSAGD